MGAPAQGPEPVLVFSTSDYNSGPTPNDPTILGNNGFADVKTPGNGRTYSVGNSVVTQVPQLPATNYFSFVRIDPPTSSWPPFTAPSGRQVVVLQVSGLDPLTQDQPILSQRYFYGRTLGLNDGGRETRARAISVWAAETPEETRIAICGETFDTELPLSQAGPIPAGQRQNGHPSAYIAVFDGNLVLQWTYHFFANVEAQQDSAATDLSIRVVEIEGQKQDLVTYCGISTYGLVASGPLAPLAPFTNVPGGPTSYVPGLGNSSTGAGQWDGFVGRVRHDRGLAQTTKEFHSIVGGTEQDGLFGLAELDESHFVVTGSTRRRTVVQVSPLAYPFTIAHPIPLPANSWNDAVFYSVGVLTEFSTASLSTTGLLVTNSHALGSVAGSAEFPVWSQGHDVSAVPYVGSYTVVGATNDHGFVATTVAVTSASVATGSKVPAAGSTDSDGFVFWRTGIGGTSPATVGVFGGDTDDAICGAAMWSEFAGYASYSGWSIDGVTGWQQMRTGCISQGSIVRERIIPTVGVTQPGACPGQTAMSASRGTLFVIDENDFSVIDHLSCGGVSLDERGRTNIVGMSLSGYPDRVVPGATQAFPVGRPEQFPLFDWDAVRSTLDGIPVGVSRTDGTGTRAGTVPQQPPQPAASSYDGGTTPTGTASTPCRAEFGWQLGMPLPEVNRILIDYHGAAPAQGVNAVIAAEGYFGGGGSVVGALMQIGLPGSTPYAPLPWQSGSTVELWAVNSPQLLTQNPVTGWAYGEWALPAMIPGPLQFSVQVLWLLQTPVACDPGGVVASPALVIDY